MLLRTVTPADIPTLYAISLATGDAGRDASALHRDGRMIGHIYSAPYAHLCPQTTFVAEDEQGVCGYIAGTFDTVAFEQRLERDWWPQLRAQYADPSGDPATWDADQRRSFLIHHPDHNPDFLTQAYPAHIHMNLLSRSRGKGIGTALLERWIAEARSHAVIGIHLGASADNFAAHRFWQAKGFARLELPVSASAGTAVWFGQKI
jgi:GNAT superfamily N-acetyltransferase